MSLESCFFDLRICLGPPAWSLGLSRSGYKIERVRLASSSISLGLAPFLSVVISPPRPIKMATGLDSTENWGLRAELGRIAGP